MKYLINGYKNPSSLVCGGRLAGTEEAGGQWEAGSCRRAAALTNGLRGRDLWVEGGAGRRAEGAEDGGGGGGGGGARAVARAGVCCLPARPDPRFSPPNPLHLRSLYSPLPFLRQRHNDRQHVPGRAGDQNFGKYVAPIASIFLCATLSCVHLFDLLFFSLSFCLQFLQFRGRLFTAWGLQSVVTLRMFNRWDAAPWVFDRPSEVIRSASHPM
ncbi:uncharacterized protein LOC125464317 [Stegostoma tigrinum]|uniref:uncharacterized protein LOC125464317 n=1 Tax=Stegostoma tigrinum TaxID=3053191 RepID=UPI00286FE116|nr:uncharacterized protein LOC125464317 [Stegostoma tigrinum]